MHRFGFLGYPLATAEFAREGQTGAALLAIALLGWSIAVELLAERASWHDPGFDRSGYGAGIGQRGAAYLAGMDRFAFVARFMSIALGVFGPLLFAWSLLL